MPVSTVSAPNAALRCSATRWNSRAVFLFDFSARNFANASASVGTGRRFDDGRLRVLGLVSEAVELVLRFLLARVPLPHATPVDHNVEDVSYAPLAFPLPRPLHDLATTDPRHQFLLWERKPQALRLVRWPGIFQSRWLTCAIGYPSVVRCSLLVLAQCEE